MINISNWHRWSERDWNEWLTEKIEIQKTVYKTKPEQLTSDFNREERSACDYHGRELLELLQNADDAGVGYASKNNKAKIKLTDSALYFANSGVPFSPKGLYAIMTSDISPKQLDQSKFIGYKGLGFRSILGWSQRPIISSGNLHVEFDHFKVKSIIEELEKECNNIANEIQERFRSRDLYPIPILTFPRPIKLSELKDQHFTEIKTLRDEGYDTVVCLPFRNPKHTGEEIAKQLKSIGKDVLLFTQYLEQVDIIIDTKPINWKAIREENQILLSENNNPPELWSIEVERGRINEDLLTEEIKDTPQYEIKIATSSKLESTGFLYAFFPTEVRFPYPVFAHATFDLTSNRQNITGSDVNRFLSQRLAHLLAVVSEKECGKDKNIWRGLNIVTKRGDLDPKLIQFDFENLLLKEINHRNIFPTKGGFFLNAHDSKRITEIDQISIPITGFEDIQERSEDEAIGKLIEELNIPRLSSTEFKQRIESIAEILTLDQRTFLIICFQKYKQYFSSCGLPSILIDESNKVIDAYLDVWLPQEESSLTLDSWVNLRILNSKLIANLKKNLNVENNASLVNKLDSYKFKEYGLSNLVSAIAAHGNLLLKSESSKTKIDDIHWLIINTLWSLFIQSKPEERIQLRDEIRIDLPSRSGAWIDSRLLYFGKEYPSGELTEGLYAPIRENLIVASPDSFPFKGDNDKLISFLFWIRVSDRPRFIKQKIENESFIKFIANKLNYSLEFDQRNQPPVDNSETFLKYKSHIHEAKNVDRLDEILLKSDPHYIITWIALEKELATLRLNGEGFDKLFVDFGSYTKNYRILKKQIIPSYIWWLIHETVWMPSGAQKLPPSKCTNVGGLPQEFIGILGKPSLDMNHHIFKKYNIDRDVLRTVFSQLNIVQTIEDLSWDTIYDLLLQLPTINKDGKKAKSIYKTFIGRQEADNPPEGKMRDKFLKEGLMWGKQGSSYKYYPISDLFYVDSGTIPQSLVSEIPLLELDRKRGAEKVRRIFGVQSLTFSKIPIQVDSSESHPRNYEARTQFLNLKPSIYALKIDEDVTKSRRNSLEKLDLILCTRVQAKATFSNRTINIDLIKNGESILANDTAYIIAQDPLLKDNVFQNPSIASALGEIIYSIWKVDVEKDVLAIAMSPVESRKELLSKITDSGDRDLLDEAEQSFMETETNKEEDIWIAPSPTSEEPHLPQDKIGDQEPEVPNSNSGSIAGINIGEKTKQPLPPKKCMAKVISITPKSSGGKHKRRMADAQRAEELILLFEEKRGNYPYSVTHQKGYDGFGCDILSFNSIENRESFLTTKDTSLIDRYIEVKSSTNEHGTIDLKGNELKSAEKNRLRYYLYRVFESEVSGIYEVAIINNPLDTDYRLIYEIDPYRSGRALYWDVKEVEKPVNELTNEETNN